MLTKFEYYIKAANNSTHDNDLWLLHLSKCISENNLSLSTPQIIKIKSKGSLLSNNDIDNLLNSNQLTNFQKSSLMLSLDRFSKTNNYVVSLLKTSTSNTIPYKYITELKKKQILKEIEQNIINLPYIPHTNSTLQALYASRFVISGRNAVSYYGLCTFDCNVEYLESDKLAGLDSDHLIYVKQSNLNEITISKTGVRYSSLNKALFDYLSAPYDDSVIEEIFDTITDIELLSFREYLLSNDYLYIIEEYSKYLNFK